jgi:beta-glucuronidase
LIYENSFVDEYEMPIGVREVKISKNKLLLNGKEIFLRGFGKHEDYWTIGKGLFLPLIVKDFQILKWINANSFRTSHYPYAEEILQYADRKGILIIDEVPAVSIDTRFVTDKTIINHKESISRLIERDYNHPCVIMWAIGNEPNLVGAESYFDGSGRKYWAQIFEHARSIDKTRPLTVPNCQRAGVDDPVFEFSDVLAVNRYYGWYENPGQITKAIELMENEMDTIFNKYKKPLMVTEFGADTMPGFHATSEQMFTEEYQAKLIEEYMKLIESKDYTVGEHIWNFADFRTPQHFRRVVMNLKGVFTRSREPKLAAFRIKELWSKE